MAGKFRNSSLPYTPQATRTYILSATFSRVLPDEVDVPCVEDYFDDVDEGGLAVENRELALDSG